MTDLEIIQNGDKVLKKILNYVLGLSFLPKVGDYLNGKKLAIGAIALVLATLRIAPTYIPECIVCPQIADGLQTLLEYVGVSFVGLGLAHKAVK